MRPALFLLIVLAAIAIADVIAASAKPIGIIIFTAACIWLSYQIWLIWYFNSKRFKDIKDSINEHTKNCNDLNHHIAELKCSFAEIKPLDYGESNLYDNSSYKFKRREWNKNIKSNRIYNCSATICKGASNQPFKYLCKYFDIPVNEESLSSFESVLNDFSAAEQGKILLHKERDRILMGVSNSIPKLILSFSKNKLMAKLGFEEIDLSDLYFPIYTFQYVSAGGNSSSKCDIKLDVNNLDRFVIYLGDLVKFKKSVAGQRALMTSSLREKIKSRDNFACKYCNLSIRDELNLLLEIDHIIPLSKGGVTTESNLQTLCWKCNRSKGSKIV